MPGISLSAAAADADGEPRPRSSTTATREAPMEQIRPAVPTATATPRQALCYDRLGADALSMKEGVLHHLEYTLAELPRHVDSRWEPYFALALAVRDRMVQRWVRTQDTYYEKDAKRIYYLSLEYLMGRTLGNSLINLGLDEV